MKVLLKIFLLLLAIFPVWLTIVALAESRVPSDTWKNRINAQLLERSDDQRKIQVIEFLKTNSDFSENMIDQNFEVTFPERLQKISELQIRFVDDSARLIRVLKVQAKLDIQEKTLIAARDVKPQARLVPEDLKTDWIEMSSSPDRIVNAEAALGRVSRAGFRAGQPILNSQLEHDYLVRIGDRVKVVVTGRGISVTGAGIARESGQKGQTVRVVNPDSKKEVFGVVTEDKRVEVRL